MFTTTYALNTREGRGILAMRIIYDPDLFSKGPIPPLRKLNSEIQEVSITI